MIRGYGVAVLSVLGALLISYWPVSHFGICSRVAVSLCRDVQRVIRWRRSGIPSYRPFCARFLLQLLPPVDSLVAKPSQIPRFLIFIVSALFVGSLTVAQRRTTESLRRTRDDLNETVQELKKTNETLGKSEAYLAETQTLSHTGTFGWNVSSGELFWSEESFRILGYERTLKPTVQLSLRVLQEREFQRVGANESFQIDVRVFAATNRNLEAAIVEGGIEIFAHGCLFSAKVGRH
jgi:hypothetical protein